MMTGVGANKEAVRNKFLAKELALHVVATVIYYGLLVPIFLKIRDAISEVSQFILLPLGTCFLLLPILWWIYKYLKRYEVNTGFFLPSFLKISSGAKEIRILNTYLPDIDLISEDLLAALIRGATIEVMLLNPNCVQVDLRADSLHLDSKILSGHIKATIAALHERVVERAGRMAGKFELHLHESWAPFSYYASEEKAMVGFYLNSRLAVHGPQLIVSNKSNEFWVFYDQFEQILKDEHTVKLDLNADWKKKIDLYHGAKENDT